MFTLIKRASERHYRRQDSAQHWVGTERIEHGVPGILPSFITFYNTTNTHNHTNMHISVYILVFWSYFAYSYIDIHIHGWWWGIYLPFFLPWCIQLKPYNSLPVKLNVGWMSTCLVLHSWLIWHLNNFLLFFFIQIMSSTSNTCKFMYFNRWPLFHIFIASKNVKKKHKPDAFERTRVNYSVNRTPIPEFMFCV